MYYCKYFCEWIGWFFFQAYYYDEHKPASEPDTQVHVYNLQQ